MKLRRIHLIYFPPAIVLDYLQAEQVKTKIVSLFQLKHNSDVDQVVTQLIDSEKLVTREMALQVRRCVLKLRNNLGMDASSSERYFYIYKSLQSHLLPLTNLAMDRQGVRCLTGSYDRTCKVWNTEKTQDSVVTLEGHSSVVYAVGFNNPLCDRVVTGSFDRTAKVWSSDGGECVATLHGHTGEVVCAQYTPGCDLIATASMDHTAMTFDSSTGQNIMRYQGHLGEIVALSFNTKTPQVFITGSFDGTVMLWDTRLHSHVYRYSGHTAGISNCSFNWPCDKVASGSFDHTVKLWDVRVQRCLATFTGHKDEVVDVAFNSCGNRLASCSSDHTVRVYAVEGVPKEACVMSGHGDEVSRVCFSPSGNTILTASADATARIWNSETGQCSQILSGHGGEVFSCAYSYMGDTIATAATDNTCKVWKRYDWFTHHATSHHGDVPQQQQEMVVFEDNRSSTELSQDGESIQRDCSSRHTTQNEEEEEEEPCNGDTRCGIWVFRPTCLQNFRTAKWALFWLCWTGALQGMVVNGFVNVVITTIEKRFGLRSSQTGLVAGGYDMASFLSLIPVTYLGGRRGASKPRWLGVGAILMGFGSLLFASPHFAASRYNAPGDIDDTCHRVTNITALKGECGEKESHQTIGWVGSSSNVLLVFLGAQLLHGAGASPLFTLGVTYIDENVSKKMSSVYLGIFYTMSIIGPAIGYVLGGQLLLIYTDFLIVDSLDLGLTADSKVWIGAWWIGFLISAALCFLVAIPLAAFPSSLPGSADLQKEKICEAYDGESSRAEAFTKIREMPRAFLALIRNPTFFFLNLAGATEGLLLSGFAAFLPKLIENQFSITASWAAILMGMVTVPAGGGGTFFGGYLVKKLKLQCSGIIKLCVWVTLAAVLFCCGFVISCPNLPFAGLTIPYGHNTSKVHKFLNLDSTCNQGCSCSKSTYDPVCGVDGIMYYSPCYAGCSQEMSAHRSKAYKSCTCISSLTLHSNNTERVQGGREDSHHEYEAINTMCDSNCSYLWLFLVLIFGAMFFTFLSTMPALSATLRCVRDDQRSFALGIQWIKVRLLGTIPAPLIFGILIDRSCILWQNSCDGKGACLVYNNHYMARSMLGLAMMAKACSLLFFFLSWWFYKAPQHKDTVTVSQLAQDNNKTLSNGCVNEGMECRF